MSWIQNQFEEGAFVRRFILIWAVLATTGIMIFVCYLSWLYTNEDNVIAIAGVLLGPTSLMLALLSGSYNKWGSSKNV